MGGGLKAKIILVYLKDMQELSITLFSGLKNINPNLSNRILKITDFRVHSVFLIEP